MHAKGGKGGANGRVIWRTTQACGAGRREEWQSLAGGGCSRRLGGRHYAPGKDVDSSFDIEVI